MPAWPLPIPGWFWAWARWRLGRGEFKPFGPANPSVRPPEAPRTIPGWAWQRLKLIAPTAPSRAFPDGAGAWLRHPRGGVEDVAEMRRAGIGWVMVNVGDFSLAEWFLVRARCSSELVACYPWARCRTLADVSALCHAASAMGAPRLGLNLEVEAKTVLPPSLAAAAIRAEFPSGSAIVSTEAWLYNDVDWRPLGQHPIALQLFPRENDPSKKPLHCVAHARTLGFKTVGVSCDGRDPASRYPEREKLPWSICFGDDVGPDWSTWRL